jgi:hypothetical protein
MYSLALIIFVVMNDHWKVLYQISVFYVDRKSKMAATAGHRLTLDPMGKCSNAFFSETTNMIKAKLYIFMYSLALIIYVLRWPPSWISDRHKIQTFCRGPSNEDDPLQTLRFLFRYEIQNGGYGRT